METKVKRVRMLKQVVTLTANFAEGDTYEIPEETAKKWCAAGLAMEDKSKDGPTEIKMKRA